MQFLRSKNYLTNWILPLFVVILSVILFFYSKTMGLIGAILSAYAIVQTYLISRDQRDRLRAYLDDLDITFDELTKNAVFNMPFPMFIANSKGEIIWYNNGFKKLTEQTVSMIDKKLSDILPDFDLKEIKSKDEEYIFAYKGHDYKIYKNFASDSNERLLTLVYLFDITEYEELKMNYEDDKLAVMNLNIDNYDEVITQVSGDQRPLLFAEIDRIISSYFQEKGGVIRKVENDKYFGVAQKSQLDLFENDKFSMVDEIREIAMVNTIVPTVSMGIGINGPTARENEKSANAALDIALGRGGDQIVIKDNDTLRYFGGKNKATEKRTKVKARVIAHALGQLIDKSSEVFVMGHKNPDMDSFGSALGLVNAVQNKNKPVHLVLSDISPAIKNLYQRSLEKYEGLADIIIKPEDAYQKIKASSLLIITDNHRKQSTEEPRLFEKCSNIFLIDHHRRGKDYIDNATLIYLEPYASSASELVTEMLMYMGDKMVINKVVAEGLLAGITVDTKNFFYQTGVRTFEAASVLKRYGADSMIVKQLFKDDIEVIKYKSEIISQAESLYKSYVVGIFDKELEESVLIASQAADDLLNAEGMEASFVLTRSKGKTHISARSLGKVSVQLIMEKLGGGGHLTASATQLDMSIEESKAFLKKAIKEYIKEETTDESDLIGRR